MNTLAQQQLEGLAAAGGLAVFLVALGVGMLLVFAVLMPIFVAGLHSRVGQTNRRLNELAIYHQRTARATEELVAIIVAERTAGDDGTRPIA